MLMTIQVCAHLYHIYSQWTEVILVNELRYTTVQPALLLFFKSGVQPHFDFVLKCFVMKTDIFIDVPAKT